MFESNSFLSNKNSRISQFVNSNDSSSPTGHAQIANCTPNTHGIITWMTQFTAQSEAWLFGPYDYITM